MLKVRAAVIVLAVLTAGGCATRPENVTAAYVSPLMYDSLECPQLREEATRVSMRVQEATGAQSKAHGRDAVMTGVALVLFWPAAFMVGGDGQTTAELSRLKGEMEAIQQASIRKNCGIQFERAPAPEPPKKASSASRTG